MLLGVFFEDGDVGEGDWDDEIDVDIEGSLYLLYYGESVMDVFRGRFGGVDGCSRGFCINSEIEYEMSGKEVGVVEEWLVNWFYRLYSSVRIGNLWIGDSYLEVSDDGNGVGEEDSEVMVIDFV